MKQARKIWRLEIGNERSLETRFDMEQWSMEQWSNGAMEQIDNWIGLDECALVERKGSAPDSTQTT